MTDLIIFGAGGHAREVAQLVADINQGRPGSWNLCGFLVDTSVSARQVKPLPAPLLDHPDGILAYPNAQLVVAIGDNNARWMVAQRLQCIQPSLHFATLVHPRAWIAQRVTLGQGSVVFAGALINVDTTIGVHTSLNLGCTISHDCVIGDFVSIGPGAHLAGGCHIGHRADIGTSASVIPGASVGAHCIVGAGACVVCNLPADCTAVGSPARPTKH